MLSATGFRDVDKAASPSPVATASATASPEPTPTPNPRAGKTNRFDTYDTIWSLELEDARAARDR